MAHSKLPVYSTNRGSKLPTTCVPNKNWVIWLKNDELIPHFSKTWNRHFFIHQISKHSKKNKKYICPIEIMFTIKKLTRNSYSGPMERHASNGTFEQPISIINRSNDYHLSRPPKLTFVNCKSLNCLQNSLIIKGLATISSNPTQRNLFLDANWKEYQTNLTPRIFGIGLGSHPNYNQATHLP